MNPMPEKIYTKKKSNHWVIWIAILAMIAIHLYNYMVKDDLSPMFFISIFAIPLILFNEYIKYIIKPHGIYIKYPFFREKLLLNYADIDYANVQKISRFTKTLQFKPKGIHLSASHYPVINFAELEQADDFLAEVKQHVRFSDTPINPMAKLTQIGYYPVYIAIFAVILMVITLWFDRNMLTAWHTSSEYMIAWSAVWITVGIVISYLIFKREQENEMPFFCSLLVGTFLGAMLCNSALSIHRYINEYRDITPMTVEMKLLFADESSQKWQVIDAKKNLHFQDGYFYVNHVWKQGYNKQLQVNKTYQVELYHSELHDIYFKPNAFHQAKLID